MYWATYWPIFFTNSSGHPGYFCAFSKSTQSKQSRIGRKFAQSGHSARNSRFRSQISFDDVSRSSVVIFYKKNTASTKNSKKAQKTASMFSEQEMYQLLGSRVVVVVSSFTMSHKLAINQIGCHGGVAQWAWHPRQEQKTRVRIPPGCKFFWES
jgi:hypothetical protein